jgi:hypothetical protein
MLLLTYKQFPNKPQRPLDPKGWLCGVEHLQRVLEFSLGVCVSRHSSVFFCCWLSLSSWLCGA